MNKIIPTWRPGIQKEVSQEKREDSMLSGRRTNLGEGLEMREKEDGKINADNWDIKYCGVVRHAIER